MLKALKFGGTSMADAKQYRKIHDIVFSDPSRRVVVVSAAGKRFSEDTKITDLLYLCFAHMKYGVSYDEIFNAVRERYLSIRDELGLNTDLESEFDALKAKMDKGRMSTEELVSRGEYFSARLMADYLGFDFIDASQWLYFHYDGTVDQEKSYPALQALFHEERGAVIPGFYGVMPDGKIRTLTRGGSDITGALAAAALDAQVYENWTDVSGMLMADPRIVDHPKAIAQATYSELRQLSFSGAQVLHEMTVFPVREKGIPLNIRNTNDPEAPGTIISEEFGESEGEGRFITGIAGKKDYSIVSIAKKGMAGAVGTLRSIVECFENNMVPIVYSPTGIDVISMVVPTEKLTPHLYSLTGELRSTVHPDSIKVTDNIAIVAAVGRKMAYRAGTCGKIFAALGQNGINIRMISQGPDELSILVGVDEKDYKTTVRVLYDAFVK